MDQSMMGAMPGMAPMSYPMAQGGGPGSPPMPMNNLFKTQLCKHFMQTKHCHVGNKCHFAHGEHELRKREEVMYRFDFTLS